MARTNLPIRYGLLSGALALFVLVYVAAAHPFSMSFASNDSRWQVVVDGVMGGRSTGRVEHTSEGILFHGDLSLENNGGFSQIRTPIERGTLAGADGLEIEVRGDGRSYIFDARVANFRVMAGSFQHGFETARDEWTTIRLAFTDYRFFAFGKRVAGVGEMDTAMIDSLGVTLADYNAGGFGLEIRAIRGYVDGDVYDERLAKLGERLGLAGGLAGGVAADSGSDEGLGSVYADRINKLGRILETRERSRARVTVMTSTYSSRVVELCVLAIERGVPMFNRGQHGACASVYEVTLVSIAHLSGEELGTHGVRMVEEALREGRHMHATERAWRYRQALDSLIEMFSGHA